MGPKGKAALTFFLACCALHAGVDADRFSARLNELDPAKPESVCAARAMLHQMLPSAIAADRTAMFRGFVSFFEAVSNATYPAFHDVFTNNPAIDSVLKKPEMFFTATLKADPTTHRILAQWLDCGFGIRDGEGEVNPYVDSTSLTEFAPQLSPEMSAWVRFHAREDQINPVVLEDAGLVITWTQLGDRLKRWEDFLRRYPGLKPEVREEIERMAYVFFKGIDNSHLTDDQMKIDPDVLSAWKRFAANSPRSRYAPLVRQWLTRVKNNNGQITEMDYRMAEAHLQRAF